MIMIYHILIPNYHNCISSFLQFLLSIIWLQIDKEDEDDKGIIGTINLGTPKTQLLTEV